MIAAFMAATQAGWYLTPINHHLVGPEIAYIVNDCEAKAFIGDERFAEACATAAKELSLPASQPAVGRRRARLPPDRRGDRRPAHDAARRPHGRRGHALHVGHHRQAQGRAPRTGRRRPRRGRPVLRLPAAAVRHPGLRRQRAHLRLAALPHGRAGLRHVVAAHRPPRRAHGQVDARGHAPAHRAPPGDAEPHGADAVPPPPRPARRREGEVRRVVAAHDDPRRRAVPDRREAAHARVVGPGDLRVLRRDRRRRHARHARAVAEEAGHRRPPWPNSEIRILDDEGVDVPTGATGHRLHEAPGPGRLRVLQGQGQDRGEPARRASSPSATSATSTTTATCSSATASPT